MLGDTEAVATIAVRSLDEAKTFYERVLELKPTENQQRGTLQYKTGGSKLLVYESRYAGTNKATAATWIVSDAEETVAALNARGVVFEHYNLPETRRKGDVHLSGQLKIAWFKDPDGNIHSVVSRHG
ncbi:MAG: VOC family protein [Thermoanaerobaculia bacterium]